MSNGPYSLGVAERPRNLFSPPLLLHLLLPSCSAASFMGVQLPCRPSTGCIKDVSRRTIWPREFTSGLCNSIMSVSPFSFSTPFSYSKRPFGPRLYLPIRLRRDFAGTPLWWLRQQHASMDRFPTVSRGVRFTPILSHRTQSHQGSAIHWRSIERATRRMPPETHGHSLLPWYRPGGGWMEQPVTIARMHNGYQWIPLLVLPIVCKLCNVLLCSVYMCECRNQESSRGARNTGRSTDHHRDCARGTHLFRSGLPSF